MAKWKADNYKGSGMSKGAYTRSQKMKKSSNKSLSKSSSGSKNKSSDPFAKYTSMSWASAADAAKRAGINTATGSDFDLAMNKKYNPENYKKLSAGRMQGPLLQSGAYYSKESADSQRNKNIRESRDQRESSNRQKASMAYTDGKTTNAQLALNRLLGVKTAQASSGGRPVSRAVGRGLEILADPLGLRPKMSSFLNEPFQHRPDLGITEKLGIDKYINYDTPQTVFRLNEGVGFTPGGVVLGSSIAQPDEVTGYGEGDTKYYNDYIPKDVRGDVFPSYRDAGGPYERNTLNDIVRQRPQQAIQPEITISEQDTQPELQPELQPEFQPELQQESQDNTPVQEFTGGTVRKLASTGAFGNGGLAGNNLNLDPATREYINSLRRSASGDFGMKDAKKQLENLLNAIEGRYTEATRIGTEELGKAKEEDLNKLLSLFSAYNTADSEQRMQTQERTQSDYQSKLADLIAKLNAQKGEEILSAKNKGLDLMGQINESKRGAQSRVADLIYRAQQDAYDRRQSAYDRAVKGTTSGRSIPRVSSEKIGRNEIFNWVENALNQGGSWGEIAEQAAAQGIPTYTGSYLDQLLNNAAKQKRYQ